MDTRAKDIILIIDGIDRSGKNTAINKFRRKFERNGYNVITFFDENDALSINDRRKYLDAYYDTVSNTIRYDVISASQLSAIARTIYLIHDNQTAKPNVFIFNRLGCSNVVNPMVLRPNQKIWDRTDYRKYYRAFKKTFIEDPEFEIFEYVVVFDFFKGMKEDNDNNRYRLDQSTLRTLNEAYIDETHWNFDICQMIYLGENDDRPTTLYRKIKHHLKVRGYIFADEKYALEMKLQDNEAIANVEIPEIIDKRYHYTFGTYLPPNRKSVSTENYQ